MVTRNTEAVLARMNITGKDVGVVVAYNGQGLITIDDFSQLNNKSVEGLCRVL